MNKEPQGGLPKIGLAINKFERGAALDPILIPCPKCGNQTLHHHIDLKQHAYRVSCVYSGADLKHCGYNWSKDVTLINKKSSGTTRKTKQSKPSWMPKRVRRSRR